MPTISSAKVIAARWVPALMLLAVAAAHLVRVLTTDQVVGKGGGFGMFAVAEVRGNRLWSAECLTPEGEPCRIYVPRKGGALDRLSPAKDSLPRDSVHDAVADRLIRGKYVRIQPRELTETLKIPRRLLERLPPATLATPLYRPARVNEEGVSLPAIRLRYWRLRFDGDAVSYTIEPMSGTRERGAW